MQYSVTFGNYFYVILILTIYVKISFCLEQSRAVLWCLELVPMPDPLPVGVVKPVCQPLGFQQVISLRVEEQRFASPANKNSVRT